MSADIDQLITVSGMITRVGGITPDLKQAFFKCTVCAATCTVLIDRGKINEPTSCAHCKAKCSFLLIHNRCLFADRQVIKMQETPDAIPDGETPHTVSLCAYDDLVDKAMPGDRLQVTGIFRAIPVRASGFGQRTQKSLFKTYLDVIHFKKVDKKRLHVPDAEGEEQGRAHGIESRADERDMLLHQERELENKIRKLGAQSDVYDRLVEAMAPSIWELDDVKKGLLLQLFGEEHEGACSHSTFQRRTISFLVMQTHTV